MSIPVVSEPDAGAVLRHLCPALEAARFPLPGPHAESGKDACSDLIHQLEDYILPRYASLDAPLLAVVGGPTGSGKSLLVNSLIREHVASSSAIRPTTRRPLLDRSASARRNSSAWNATCSRTESGAVRWLMPRVKSAME